MGGNLNADYEFAKEEVERLHAKVQNQKKIAASLTSSENYPTAKKYEQELERELHDWEGERDRLKHEIDEINKNAEVGRMAAVIPGEGTIVAAATEAEAQKKSAAAAKKAEGREEKLKEHAHEHHEPSGHKEHAERGAESGEEKSEDGDEKHDSASEDKKPSRFKRAWRWLRHPDRKAELPAWYAELAMLFAILCQVAEVLWLRYLLTPGTIALRIGVYFVVALVMHFTINKGWSVESSIFELFKVSAIPVFLLPLVSGFAIMLGASDTVMGWINTGLFIFPYWIFYLYYTRGVRPTKSKSAGEWWARRLLPTGIASIWVIAIVIALLFNVVMATGTMAANTVQTVGGGTLGSTGFDVTAGWKGAKDIFGATADNVKKSIEQIGTSAKTSVSGWRNATLGQDLSSQVEQNKELTGIFITSMEFASTPYDTEDTVVIGAIKARSFGEKTTIKPKCYAQETTGDKKVFPGKSVEPASIDMYREDQLNVMCNYGVLPKGSYYFYMELDFDFETGAYVVYTFMDDAVAEQMEHKDNININTYFNVPPLTKTTYTAGPVVLAMSNKLAMPVKLGTGRTNTMAFGLSVANDPQSTGAMGSITSLNEVTMKVPKSFVVKTCQVKSHQPASNPYYEEYTFVVPKTLAKDDKLAIGCNAEISPEAAKAILSDPAGINAITIQGVAKYDYNLTRRLSGQVLPMLVT
jgi:hypothetical protein